MTSSASPLTDTTAPMIVTALLKSDDAVHSPVRVPALTVLVETARRWDHVATGHLLPVIRNEPHWLLACGGTVIERTAGIDECASALPGLGALLNGVIGAGRNLTLDVGAVAVQQQLVGQARGGKATASLASALTTLSVRLGSVGRRRKPSPPPRKQPTSTGNWPPATATPTDPTWPGR